MKKKVGLWSLAVLITIIAVVYQRVSGPTYPKRVKYQIGETVFKFKLQRSQGGSGDQIVTVPCPQNSEGTVFWRLYPSKRPYQSIIMTINKGKLTARLPHQPPAGKIEYYISLKSGNQTIELPQNGKHVVTRFKGHVPPMILIPHIILMFIAMLTSNRLALEVLTKGDKTRYLTFITFICLVLGGLVLGCTVQHYAFGQAWTGFPIGHDLTDNKLGIAVLIWLFPVIQTWRKRECRMWILAATIVILIIFTIPHSMFGSQLDPEKSKLDIVSQE